jgi:hypothetical protein
MIEILSGLGWTVIKLAPIFLLAFMLDGLVRVRRWHIRLCVISCILLGTGFGCILAIWPYGRGDGAGSPWYPYRAVGLGISLGLVAGLILGRFLLFVQQRQQHVRKQPKQPTLPDVGPSWFERVSSGSLDGSVQPHRDHLSSSDARTDPD